MYPLKTAQVRSLAPIMIERRKSEYETALDIGSPEVLSEHRQCQLIFGQGKKRHYLLSIFL